MTEVKIGFFGAGNMAEAISSSIKDLYPKTQIYFYTPSGIKAQNLAQKLNTTWIKNISEMPLDLDFYFLAFKPQNFEAFDFNFKDGSKIVSVLAGTSLNKITTQ